MSRIEHFALFADDLESLRAFYAGTMGLHVVLDNSRAPVPGYFLADDGGSVLELIQRPAGAPGADTRFVCHVAFTVNDYPSARSDLEGRGATFEADTEVLADDFKTGFFRDPAGNRCQIVWRSRPLVP